jgi:hypothetical protein
MKISSMLFAVILVYGCQSIPPHPFLVTPEMLAQRQFETRRFDGIDEANLLSACANVLQDLGFNLENSETKLGLLTASKERGAIEAKEVILSILVAMMGGGAVPYSKDQTIRVSLVVRTVNDSNGNALAESHYVRVIFQRLVRRTDNSVYVETLHDSQLYQIFFDRVSKSVFIEAQHI